MKDDQRPLFRMPLHRPAQGRAEMDEELRFHIEESTARLVAKGMTPEAARAEAIRRLGPSAAALAAEPPTPSAQIHNHHPLGDSAAHRERVLGMRDYWNDFIDDLRYAARGLARRPAFTAVAIATLAIGIGANTAIFSAVDALLLRSLPFREPERLMDIGINNPDRGFTLWSVPKAKAYQEAQQSFSSTALYSAYPITLTGAEPERVGFETVSASYLATLGQPVARGHDFGPELDAGPGVGAFAIISDALWKRRFSGADDAVGKRLEVDGQPFEIVGVLPPGFRGVSGNADVLVNVTSRDAASLGEAWSHEFDMVGRLKPGVTPEQAVAEARRIGANLYEAFPPPKGMLTTSKALAWGAGARPLNSIRVAGLLRRSLFVLFGAVGMVLLIACVNLANLLLARASARRREIAVRLAIGASRGRLIRLMLAESILLAIGGGAAGITLAWWAARVLSTLNPAEDLRAQNLSTNIGAIGFSGIHLDATALLFTLGVTLAVGVLFGLVPALGGSRVDLTEGLKDDGAATRPGRTRLGIDRRVLVIAEVTLATVLLAGSGLMVRSLVNLMSVDAGFRGENVLTLRITVPRGSLPVDSMPEFYETMRERVAAVPGVSAVSIADCAPIAGGCNATIMTFADRPQSATQNSMVGVHWVSPDWFGTMGVPIKRGRVFDASDRAGAPKVVVINEAAARLYFKGEDPIGKRVAVYQGGFNTGAEVIGIVGDVRFATIGVPPKPDAYISYAQSTPGRAILFIKTSGDPVALAPAVRAALKQVAPFSPVFDIRTMDQRVRTASGQARLSTTLLTGFSLVALALALMGIYGVMSFAVAQRTREIGIRVAMGADGDSVVRLFTREGLVLSGAGVAIGLAGAFALTRVMRGLLFGVAPDDLFTFVAIVAVVMVATVLATWIPARRASRLDPVEALR